MFLDSGDGMPLIVQQNTIGLRSRLERDTRTTRPPVIAGTSDSRSQTVSAATGSVAPQAGWHRPQLEAEGMRRLSAW
jgi:hypothetical protein